jgi:hypothetical protein
MTRVTLLCTDSLSIKKSFLRTRLHIPIFGDGHYACCWEEVSASLDITLVQSRTLEVGYLAILE